MLSSHEKKYVCSKIKPNTCLLRLLKKKNYQIGVYRRKCCLKTEKRIYFL